MVVALQPGDIVIVEDLSSQRVIGAIEATGASVLYLPLDPPDLRPIELVFNKFKTLLRDGAARIVDKLWDFCGRVLDLFTADEYRGHDRHSGCCYT